MRDQSSPVLEINLLGPFRVTVDGAALEQNNWIRRKPKSLVKLLALQPHHQCHREQLLEVLWPQMDVQSAANNLHKAIHLARRALEPALKPGGTSRFIYTDTQQVALGSAGQLRIDVEEFEQAAAGALRSSRVEDHDAALELYNGDLLIEDLYEEWTALRRERLRSIRRELLFSSAMLYEKSGGLHAAIERLTLLLSDDSSNEEAHRQLMRLYAIAGIRQRAMQQYRDCCEALRIELDAEPDQQTLDLYKRISGGEFAGFAQGQTSTQPAMHLESESMMPGSATVRRPGSEPRDRVTPADSIAPRGVVDSLAILPLVNSSGQPDLEYLVDGITESIIDNLSQLNGLRVMARSTVFKYKGRNLDPAVAGRELGVRAVLAGALQQVEGALVINAELVDIADGSQLWGEKLRNNMSDVVGIEIEMAREISRRLQIRLTGAERQRLLRRYTESTEAYHLYLKGRYHWNKRSAAGVRKAIEYFSNAIETDPNYALAYAGVADCYNVYTFIGDLSPREAYPRARAAAGKALAIDNTLAEAHASLANALANYDWDWNEAEREFRRAIEIDPKYATAHQWYGEFLQRLGYSEEGIAELEIAWDLDPLSLIINRALGRALFMARRYDEAARRLRLTLDIDPNFIPALSDLGMIYERMGLVDEGIEQLRRALDPSCGRPEVLGNLGHAYAVNRQTEEAERCIDQLVELSASRYVSAAQMALIAVGLGRNSDALQWLRKASRERAWSGGLLLDSRWDSLRTDPRFDEILRSFKLIQEPSKGLTEAPKLTLYASAQ